MIGSRRKIKLIFEGLREAGVSDAALERVTAPIGLNIGSRTVPEIAISIAAELIAVRNLGVRDQGSRAGGRIKASHWWHCPASQRSPEASVGWACHWISRMK